MAKTIEIPEAKIRQAIWMLKTNKTKKSICEHLGIAYNTKRIDTIISEFREKQARTQELKTKARQKPLTHSEELSIISSYEEGESMSAIAEKLYLTPQRIKKVLLTHGVPLRARKKKGAAQVDHIVQDLEVKFSIGDRVFVSSTSEFATIQDVFDEEWIQYHSENYRSRYVELSPLKEARKQFGEEFEGREDVHWNIYWEYENGRSCKSFAMKHEIARHQEDIARYGRETYLIAIMGDQSHYRELPRHQLFPIRHENGN